MRILVIGLLAFALFSITPLANSNAYLKSHTYDTVQVSAGDTLWGIAAHYTTEKDDIRELTYAITELNKLNKNAQIYPGQTLKIPVKQSR